MGVSIPVVFQSRLFDVTLDGLPENNIRLVLVAFGCPAAVRQVEFESLARSNLGQAEMLLRVVIECSGTTC